MVLFECTADYCMDMTAQIWLERSLNVCFISISLVFGSVQELLKDPGYLLTNMLHHTTRLRVQRSDYEGKARFRTLFEIKQIYR